MAKKETEAIEAIKPAGAAPVADEPKIWIYYGPSIRGVVTHGRIFRGARAEVLQELKNAIEKYPQIERLVVADKELKKARSDMREKKGIYIPYTRLMDILAGKEV